jgi:hypothetical protein
VIRTAASAGLIFVCTAALSACASGSTTPKISPAALYNLALSALEHAPAAEFTGSTTPAGQPAVKFDVQFTGSASAATLRIGAEVIDVRIVNGVRYLRTNPAVWADLGLSSYAGQFADHWFAFRSGPPAIMGGFTTMTSSWLDWVMRTRLTHTVFANFVPTGAVTTATAHGTQCYVVTSEAGGRLYVSTRSDRPVEYAGGADGTGAAHFSYPTSPPSMTEPAPVSTLPPAPRTSG